MSFRSWARLGFEQVEDILVVWKATDFTLGAERVVQTTADRAPDHKTVVSQNLKNILKLVFRDDRREDEIIPASMEGRKCVSMREIWASEFENRILMCRLSR